LKRQQAIGLDPHRVSGHSLRRGDCILPRWRSRNNHRLSQSLEVHSVSSLLRQHHITIPRVVPPLVIHIWSVPSATVPFASDSLTRVAFRPDRPRSTFRVPRPDSHFFPSCLGPVLVLAPASSSHLSHTPPLRVSMYHSIHDTPPQTLSPALAHVHAPSMAATCYLL
jgi:hypothetical protein